MKNKQYLFFATGIGIFFLLFSSMWLSDKDTGVENASQFYQTENFMLQVIKKSNEDILSLEIKNGITSSGERAKRSKELEFLTQFEIRLKKKKPVGDLSTDEITLTSEEMKYFSFHFDRDLKLIEAGDTLRPVLYHFESSGLQFRPYQSAIVAFENKCRNTCDYEFLINSPFINSKIVKLNYPLIKS